MFDWHQFFDDNGIEYVSGGRNLSKGNIAIRCPFCGDDDPSQHMNVSVKGKGWRCWRDAEHGGISAARLIQALLKCTWAEAAQLAGTKDQPLPVNEEYLARLQELYPSERITRLPRLTTPKEWRPLHNATGISANLLMEYIRQRGYSKHDANQLAARYDLQYTLSEKRIIFPIRDEQARLVNYTARTINPRNSIRYKTAPGEQSAKRMSECLLDLPRLLRTEGEALIVCEGPFDAPRIGWIGEALGIYATCVFTQNISEAQIALLLQLHYLKFKRLFILFDQAAMAHALKAQAALSGSELLFVPEGVKDPGEMSPAQVLALCRDVLGFSLR